MVQQGKITTWDDFAKEARLIWSNAKEYNEPGSEIYLMAEELETWTEEKLQEHGVPPKVVQRLSLKTQPQPRQLKLKLGTPVAPAVNGGNSYIVDQAALDRQRIEMASALNQARGGSRADSTPAPTVHSSSRRSGSVIDVDIPMTGTNMNGHTASAVEPAKPVIPPGPSNIPTPTLEGEPPRQVHLQSSVHPPSVPQVNGYNQNPFPTTQLSTVGNHTQSTNPIDRKFRDPNKSAFDAIIQSVTYMTNPFMPSDPKWRLIRSASATKTQVSYYTYLPSTHSSLRIIPDLHADLKAGKRKYKLFVLNNGAVIPASPDVAGQGVYDLHLVPGENVVAVEAISALEEGERKEYAREHEQFDFERVTFYIFLRSKGQ